MIPLRDNIPHRQFPFVMIGILILNVLAFLYEVQLDDESRAALIGTFGVVPARMLAPPVLSVELITLVTAQFLHGGWLHLFSNMLALFIFGDNVEDRLGHLRFLLFYLLAGVIGGLVHVWSDPASAIPAVGASGALAGVLGAYVVLFPTARVTTLVLIFFIPWFIQVPAVLWLGGWFLSQLFSGVVAITDRAEAIGGGVGYWAHIGGFVAGVLMVLPARFSRARVARAIG